MVNQHEPNRKDVTEPITWAIVAAWIAQAVIKKIAEEVAEPIIKDLLGKEDINFKKLLRSSIDEILSNLKSTIDDALDEEFIVQYIGICEFIKRQLILYEQTKDENLIKDMQIMSGQVTQLLYDKGIKAFGGLLVACNLHLLSLRALAEKKPEWRQGLVDHFTTYANWIEEVGTAYWSYMKTKVAPVCFCNPEPLIAPELLDINCDDLPPDLRRWSFVYDFNVESIRFGSYEECEDARFNTWDEQLLPSMELVAQSKGMIHQYREFRLDE
ncbi:MAG: hypothetical protein K0Q73_7136 [Paenibacillus sp.]|jgi:hypothetical protein|nr:hypothetical protein [Paenibacillus sp.]